MSLIPEFQIALWNGWWFSLAHLAIMLGLMRLFSKDAAKRMMTWPEMNKTEQVIAKIEIVLHYGLMIYAIFVPLKLGTAWFSIGTTLAVLGMIIYTVATINYAGTQLDQPVITGIYRISRSPMFVASFITWIGVGIATASWVIIVAEVVLILLMHTTTLAEERTCLAQYGESYQEYMNQTPRYFVFF